MKRSFWKIVGQALCFYGLLAWLNGEFTQFLEPDWMKLPLWHVLPWLQCDNFTVLSFFVSALGFLVWRLNAQEK